MGWIVSLFMNSFIGRSLDKIMLWLIAGGGILLLGFIRGNRRQKQKQTERRLEAVLEKQRIDEHVEHTIDDADVDRIADLLNGRGYDSLRRSR